MSRKHKAINWGVALFVLSVCGAFFVGAAYADKGTCACCQGSHVSKSKDLNREVGFVQRGSDTTAIARTTPKHDVKSKKNTAVASRPEPAEKAKPADTDVKPQPSPHEQTVTWAAPHEHMASAPLTEGFAQHG